jgi:hypothetical protein
MDKKHSVTFGVCSKNFLQFLDKNKRIPQCLEKVQNEISVGAKNCLFRENWAPKIGNFYLKF